MLPARQPPIFVLSVERSGSTLLRYVLDTHPAIGSPGELGLGRLSSLLFGVVSRTRPQTARPILVARVRQLLDEIMAEYLAAIGKEVWCDKAPINVEHLDLIAEAFADARFLCLYRNCLDNVRSCVAASVHGIAAEHRRHVSKHPGNMAWAMTENWCDKTQRILTFETGHGSKCHRIRYEDLVRAPDVTLEGIMRFLHLEWDPGILDLALTLPHYQGGGDYKIQLESRIHTRSVGLGTVAHIKDVPAAVVDRINDLSINLGYALVSPRHDTTKTQTGMGA